MFARAGRFFSRSGRRRRIGWRDAVILILSGILALSGTLGYFAYTLPLPDGFSAEVDRPSMLIKSEDGEVFASRGVYRGDRLKVDELPPHLLQAVVAIEDKRFYEHSGVDPRGIFRAVVANFEAGAVRQGGSTITQQLAKTYFLEQDRTIKRKIQDMMLALWLENRLSKDEILARYLNHIYFGAGAYGVDAASWRYFRKSARSLTLPESAMLAGLIQAPSWYSPVRDLDAAQAQARTVLTLMVEQGYIDEEQASAARDKPATLAVAPDIHPGWNYFADWVEEENRRLLGPMTADLQVKTTLVPEIQTLAENTVARWNGILGNGEDSVQTALLAMTLDGGVVAMVGGKDYGESQFNRATMAQRQPGSAFKLFVYLAALDAGFTPDSLAMDEPIEIDGWRPRNHNGRFEGKVTLRTAFAQSINTVAVKLTEHVGRDKVIGVARLLGVKSDIRPTPSMPLGSFEMNLLEMTGAYAAIAADVKRVEPYAITEIRGRGRTLYRYSLPSGANRGILPWKRDQMLDMLMATVKEGTGRAADIGRPVAGKTGTSEDNRDGWFIGFTGDLVVGVWVGRDDNLPVEGLNGGGLPARIWRDFMTEVYRSPASGGAAAISAEAVRDMSSPAMPVAGNKPLSFQDIGDVIKDLFKPE
ncbi:MAG: PBP1A family penicillin-binding protein [Alphaproteobacteria bacterium]|nr:PBP1A family penicillin-binding protein [Alphaproteobacteria bacterium]